MDFDVTSVHERYDFTNARHGASMWVDSKSEAVNVVRAFTAWAKENGKLMTAGDERVGRDDPRGQGYRVFFHERADPAAKALKSIDAWFQERTKPSKHPPRNGWHFMSALHCDYEEWFDDAGLRPNEFLSLTRFSQLIAARPEVTRTRTADGSIVIGMALKDAEIFVIPRHTTINGVVSYAPPEPLPTGWGEDVPAVAPVEGEEVARPKAAYWVVEGEGPPPEMLVDAYQESEDPDPDGFNEQIVQCPICDKNVPVDVVDNDGTCPNCAAE